MLTLVHLINQASETKMWLLSTPFKTINIWFPRTSHILGNLHNFQDGGRQKPCSSSVYCALVQFQRCRAAVCSVCSTYYTIELYTTSEPRSKFVGTTLKANENFRQFGALLCFSCLWKGQSLWWTFRQNSRVWEPSTMQVTQNIVL